MSESNKKISLARICFMSQAENRLDCILDVNINSESVTIFYFCHKLRYENRKRAYHE